MAGDLAAKTNEQPTPNEMKGLDEIRAGGVQMTTVTEMMSMAASPSSMNPLLVSLKAVDPALYPFYGDVDLAPAMGLKAALGPGSVAVGDDLLLRLGLHVGDPLKVGGQTFRIAATVVNEPDRLSGNFEAGPRVLISRDALDTTGLLGPGNHATERLPFKLPLPGDGRPVSDTAVAALKTKITDLLPEAQITDYRETNPSLTEGLDRATSLLSLMSLVALVLGAVGVAMAMRAHLQQRLDTIAIMKSLGARSGQIMKIYLLQTLLLGLAGGLLGVLLGVAVQLAFPLVLGKLINVPTVYHIQPRAIFAGLGAGMLTTLLFTLPPLLDIRRVRPILILRRAVEDNDDPFIAALWKKINHNIAQILATALILVGLVFIAMTLSDSLVVGQRFSEGLVGVLLVLLAASAAVLRGLKFFLNRTRLHLPSALRHGLANLYRPGNPSAALLAALGMGVMQIMTVYLVQRAVVNELHISSAPNLPNVFLVDIANTEIDGMRALLKTQPGVTTQPELLPLVSARVLTIDGKTTEEARAEAAARAEEAGNEPEQRRGPGERRERGPGRRMQRTVSLTWAEELPPGTTVVEGVWWKPGERKPRGGDCATAGEPYGSETWVHHHVCGAGPADLGDCGGVDQGQRATCVFARGVYPAQGCTGWASGSVERRRACAAGARERIATRVVRGVSHGNGDQRGAGSGDGARGCDPDYLRDPVSGGVLHLRGRGDSGVVDCGNEVPAHPRGGGAEDAGRDSREDCGDLLH